MCGFLFFIFWLFAAAETRSHLSGLQPHSSEPMKAVKCPMNSPQVFHLAGESRKGGQGLLGWCKDSGKAAKVICQDGGLQGGLPIGVTRNEAT